MEDKVMTPGSAPCLSYLHPHSRPSTMASVQAVDVDNGLMPLRVFLHRLDDFVGQFEVHAVADIDVVAGMRCGCGDEQQSLVGRA